MAAIVPRDRRATGQNKVPRNQRVRQGGAGRLGATQTPVTNLIETQAQYNRPNEVNPFGSLSYERDPTTGAITQRTTLAPEEQQMLDQQRSRDIGFGNIASSQLSGLQGLLSSPFSTSDLRNDPNQMDFSADRRRIEDATYNQVAGRLQPQFDREESQFRQRMAVEGIPEGSDRYNNAFREMKQSQNDALTNAGFQATREGGTELERSTNLALAGRGAAVNERLMGRNQPMQELASILGMQRGVSLPQFQNRSEIDAIGASLGLGGLNLSERELSEATRHNKASESISRLAASKAGSGQADPFALANLGQQHALDRMRLQAELNRGNQPSTTQQVGGFLSNLAGSFGGGYLQGLGQKWGLR